MRGLLLSLSLLSRHGLVFDALIFWFWKGLALKQKVWLKSKRFFRLESSWWYESVSQEVLSFDSWSCHRRIIMIYHDISCGHEIITLVPLGHLRWLVSCWMRRATSEWWSTQQHLDARVKALTRCTWKGKWARMTSLDRLDSLNWGWKKDVIWLIWHFDVENWT